ncbi:dephospho-CoA kinase [Trypanosoma rangeli]|uniref:Dephospho-CoA kinase n=1 Tax=Trypanosoma rangeli TaxID=5698 RepID=A0A3R7MVE2_TRYRA|nr:dephospho-CoA kinase [Trypanosoma rangeli]RNE95930.1 dephospho-CoA kinase [Trypanosoma rangeli]|eukprot:RNE95930.1 dephospho-CoA kinase [Trypanosoma rangeli]
MLLIGLTGGIACGKSTMVTMLEQQHQIIVIDADRVVRGLQRPFMPCTRKIARRWPECVDLQTGELDRAALAGIIFRDPQARRELARIMYFPIFASTITSLLLFWWQSVRRRLRGEGPLLVVLDVPLLYESKIYTLFIDAAVVVGSTEELQIARLMKRNGLTREEVLQRIRAQMPVEEKCRRADYVIRNNGTVTELACSVNDSVIWMRQQSGCRMDLIVFGIVGGGIACLAAAGHLLCRLLC